MGDKKSLCYSNENTTPTSSKTVFVKGNPNPSPPQVSTSPKKTKQGKGKHLMKPIKKKT